MSGVSLGNAERAAWFADHGSLDVVVLAPEWPGYSLASDQSPFSVVRYPSKAWLPYRLTRVPRAGARAVIERALDEAQPDAVVLTDVERAFFFASWCLPGLRWAREHDVPYVAHYHTDFDNFARRYPGWRRLRRLTRPVTRYLYRQVDATICATSSAAQQMRELAARRSTTFHSSASTRACCRRVATQKHFSGSLREPTSMVQWS
jgi:phosphatidylinositol alpha 1,6-mannosyltransferase